MFELDGDFLPRADMLAHVNIAEMTRAEMAGLNYVVHAEAIADLRGDGILAGFVVGHGDETRRLHYGCFVARSARGERRMVLSEGKREGMTRVGFGVVAMSVVDVAQDVLRYD